MQILRKLSSTSNVLRATLRNSTTGAGLTGLTSASSGLIISTIADNEATATTYTVAGSTIETITTLGTFATPTATKCRFKEVDATNHPGLYEIQLADARFAVSSAKVLRVCITGATNLLGKDILIQLEQAPADVTHWTGTAVATPDTAGYPKVTHKVGTGTGELSITSGVVDANTTKFGGAAGTFASGRPEVNTTHAAGTAWNSGGITSSTFAAGAINAAAIAADAIGASELAADAVTEIAAGISIPSAATIAAAVRDVSNLTPAANSLGAYVANALDAASAASDDTTAILATLGSPAGASVSVDIAAIAAKTTFLSASSTNTANIGTTNIASVATSLYSMITANKFTTAALSNAPGGGTGGVAGPGASSCTLNFKDETAANIADADVWLSTDTGGNTVVAGTLQTNSSGNVTFLLDAGSTYYVWLQKDGKNPILGTAYVAVAD